jgi:hypothetical protein
MKKTLILALAFVGLGLNSCTNYEPASYGPVEFESFFEGPLYAGSVVDAIIELDFAPQDYGINADEVHSMVMKEIVLNTDYENGFGDFDNISFIISADGVEAANVATIKIKDNSNTLTIPGLSEAEIKKFKGVKKYYLQITAVTKADLEDTYEDVPFTGSFTMNIMVPEKKK